MTTATDALPDDLTALLRRPAICFIATTNPDGSPQLTQTWVDTDGAHVVVNTVEGFRKTRNLERDPRVALNIADPDDHNRYWALTGHVLTTTTDGGVDSIEQLAQKYLGTAYPWFGGRDQVRVILTIAVDKIVQRPY